MPTKDTLQRQAVEMLCTDMLVPKDHLLRKIEAAVDFEHIYALVGGLYCADNGRPSVDPVVLLKLILIQHLYGIGSLRQTVKDADMNIAYRWFIGYTMAQPIPHFATISYAFANRFTSEIIVEVFSWILEEANADREKHGKKPFDNDDDHPKPPKAKGIAQSTTDPDSGVFHKGEHKKCFAYEAHTVCDNSMRSRTIERVFANAKEKYAMRYTPYRGLDRVSNWVRLKFAAMNLKNWPLGSGNPAFLLALFRVCAGCG